jgi:hypothetical protein
MHREFTNNAHSTKATGQRLSEASVRGYLHLFNTYSRTYGSLGAVMILLMWLYVTGLAFLIGGEVNADIEHAPLSVGIRKRKRRVKRKLPSMGLRFPPLVTAKLSVSDMTRVPTRTRNGFMASRQLWSLKGPAATHVAG